MQQDIDYGKAISYGYGTFFEIVGKILPLALVAGAVSLALQLLGGFVGYFIFDAGSLLSAVVVGAATIASTIVSLMVAGAIGGAIVKMIRGAEPDSVLPGVDALTSPAPGLAGVAIKMGLILGALQAASSVLGSILGSKLGALIGIVAGVASIYLAVRWYFAPIAATAEDLDRDQAMTRSETMATGRFWNVVLLLIIIGICAGIPVAICGGILGALVGVVLGVVTSSIWVAAIAGGASMWAMITALLTPLAGAMLASAYADLNPGEGSSGDDRASSMQATTTYSPMDAE